MDIEHVYKVHIRTSAQSLDFIIRAPSPSYVSFVDKITEVLADMGHQDLMDVELLKVTYIGGAHG